MVKEEGSINFDCLCQAALSPSSLTIAHQGYPFRQSYSLLYFQKRWELDYPSSAMSGDKRDATDGCLRFRECAPRTCTPSPFVDRGSLLNRKALSASSPT